MPSISGTIYQSGTAVPLGSASVRFDHAGCPPHQVFTEIDGRFRQDDLEPGEWSVFAWQAAFLPYQEKVDLSKGDARLAIHLSTQHDEATGKRFFFTLLAVLGTLILAYILLHGLLAVKEPPISQALSATITDVTARVKASEKPGSDAELQDALAAFSDQAKAALGATARLSAEDKQVALALVDEINGSAAAGKKDAALSRLAQLHALVLNPPGGYFTVWVNDPLRMPEIMLWGLAGVLVGKIIQVGWYLRRGTYYRQGLWVDTAHLVTTPILVLVTVLLLSLVTIKVTLAGGNDVTLDLSDPRIMVAFAFVIGTVPWIIWRFVEKTAKRFTGQ